MDFLHDFAFGVLMLFISFIMFDWGRIWWHARRHGYIKLRGAYGDPPWRWEQAYLGYKIWTWFVRALTWVLTVWHLSIAASWFVEIAFALTT